MKSKSSNKAIDTFIKKMKTFKKKGINELAEQTQAIVKKMESGLDNSVGLEKEIQKLKDDLKIKKNDLKTELQKLKKDFKEFRKAQKNDKKTAKNLKPGKKKK